MTALDDIYNAFLGSIEEDDWVNWEIDLAKEDWLNILKSAIPWFKFPKTDLSIDGDHMIGDLSLREIQILALYMKVVWANRCLYQWDKINNLYTERDFSMANEIDKLLKVVQEAKKQAEQLEKIYYRVKDNKSYLYRNLYG